MGEEMVEIRRYSVIPVIFQWSLVLVMSCCVAIVGCLFAKQSTELGAAIGIGIFFLLFWYADSSPSAILICPSTKTLHTRFFIGEDPAPVDVARFRYVRSSVSPPEYAVRGFSVILELLTDLPGEHYVVSIYHSFWQSFMPVKYHETADCKNARLLLVEHLGIQDAGDAQENIGWLPPRN